MASLFPSALVSDSLSLPASSATGAGAATVWPVGVTVVSFCLCWLVFGAAHALKLRDSFLSSTVVSVMHAGTTVVFSAWYLPACFQSSSPFLLTGGCEYEGLNPQILMDFYAVSLGYFLYDTMLCLFVLSDWEAALHHFFCCLGEYSILRKGVSGYLVLHFVLCAEISTPFLYAFQTKLVPPGSLAALACQASFACLFILLRGVVGPVLMHPMLTTRQPLEVRGSAVGLLLISFVWMRRVFQGIAAVVWPAPAGSGEATSEEEEETDYKQPPKVRRRRVHED